jgi:NAD(P)-dependent dehydrogenase (short-subunit alcohol dehydrogenase family)
MTQNMLRDLFSVEGKVVVVTGGCGQLGWQFARTLIERGARVAAFDLDSSKRRPEDLDNAGLNGDLLMTVPVDVTRRDSIEAGLAKVNSRWGTPDALINNAALDSPPNAPAEENGPFESYPESSWEKVMDVNAKGVFLCCQVIGSQMAVAGRGSIVNISSIYGVVSPDQHLYEYRRTVSSPAFFKPVAYSASKSSLLNLTRYLATYWAEKNVRVNTLTFGGVFNNQDEQFLRNYSARVPMRRMAREDEYNGAIVFLLSDASSYMTGANLTIDGGWTAW